jgi:hypothetical protein
METEGKRCNIETEEGGKDIGTYQGGTDRARHRVYKMPGFLQSRPNCIPPPPHPQGSVAHPPPPPVGPRGETHSLGGGEWGDPIPTKRQTLWYPTGQGKGAGGGGAESGNRKRGTRQGKGGEGGPGKRDDISEKGRGRSQDKYTELDHQLGSKPTAV